MKIQNKLIATTEPVETEVMLSDVAIAGNELERVVHDLKLELTGKSKKHNQYQ